jgi:hypothetical protein
MKNQTIDWKRPSINDPSYSGCCLAWFFRHPKLAIAQGGSIQITEISQEDYAGVNVGGLLLTILEFRVTIKFMPYKFDWNKCLLWF